MEPRKESWQSVFLLYHMHRVHVQGTGESHAAPARSNKLGYFRTMVYNKPNPLRNKQQHQVYLPTETCGLRRFNLALLQFLKSLVIEKPAPSTCDGSARKIVHAPKNIVTGELSYIRSQTQNLQSHVAFGNFSAFILSK
jgi:hypothetical protein